MVSLSQQKVIRSLQQKKFRKKQGLFIVEGEKMVQELLDSTYNIEQIYYSQHWKYDRITEQMIGITDMEMKKISALNSPSNVLAVVKIPVIPGNLIYNETTVLLDGIKDPGNLGTIIRICDWFGISQMVCTDDTVDVYNPKVVQSTMGSLFRVNMHYLDKNDIDTFISRFKGDFFCADLEGENVLTLSTVNPFTLVIGSESHGIKTDFGPNKTKITIPGLGKAESLNAGVSTGIILSHILKVRLL